MPKYTKEAELAYLCGLFDGEGYAGFSGGSDNKYPRMAIGMTDKGPITAWFLYFHTGHLFTNLLPSGKLMYHWEGSCRIAAHVAEQLLAYSVNESKRAALQAIVDYYKLKDKH